MVYYYCYSGINDGRYCFKFIVVKVYYGVIEKYEYVVGGNCLWWGGFN